MKKISKLCHPLAASLLLLLRLSSDAPTAEATFSIVATDGHTRQVGGAGASCNPSGDVYSGLYLSAPGKSVLHTQALLLERNSPIVATAREMMRREERIEDILDRMETMDGGDYKLSVGSFRSSELRQYGMADFETNGGYTGRGLETAYSLAGMADGTEQVDLGPSDLVDDRFSYHALGNDVAEGTVEALQSGFLNEGPDESNADDPDDDHCRLANRLMAAMERVWHDGLGDMRCISDRNGITATGAYLHVDAPDGRVVVHINKAGDGSYEPVEALKREFAKWQVEHGCRVDAAEGGPTTMEDSTMQPAVDASAASSEGETRSSRSVFVASLSVLLVLAALAVSQKVRSRTRMRSTDDQSDLEAMMRVK